VNTNFCGAAGSTLTSTGCVTAVGRCTGIVDRVADELPGWGDALLDVISVNQVKSLAIRND